MFFCLCITSQISIVVLITNIAYFKLFSYCGALKWPNQTVSLSLCHRSCWLEISLMNWRWTRWRKMFQSARIVPKDGYAGNRPLFFSFVLWNYNGLFQTRACSQVQSVKSRQRSSSCVSGSENLSVSVSQSDTVVRLEASMACGHNQTASGKATLFKVNIHTHRY